MERIGWTSAFAFAWLVWLGGMAIGYAVVEWTSRLPAEMIEIPSHMFGAAQPPPQEEATARALAAQSSWDVFLFILARNFSVYLWLLAGLLSAGAITFLVLFANGILLGQAIGVALWQGMPPGAVGDLLLPHGVLELGTFCIAGAVGFQGLRVLREWSERGWAAVRALRLGLVLAFGGAALAVAAGVEAFVTADLAEALYATVSRKTQP